MKKGFILFIFCSFLLNSFGQEDTNFGLQFDINGIPLNNYCDFDYTPDKILKISLTIGEKYAPGAYYDLNRTKHEGFIKIDPLSHEFEFKDKASNEITLDPKQCIGLTILKDSFVVIKNFEIEKTFGKSTITKEDFAEVIAKSNDYTIYKHTRFKFDGSSSETYIIKADTANRMVSLFNKSMLIRYFGNFKALKGQILDEHFTIDNLSSISKIYDYKKKYDHNEKIFYSSSWDEIEDSTKSAYYSKIVNLKDTIWELKFFNKKDEALYLGHFSSFSPTVKDGEFIWYFPNGNIRKKLTYKNNEITGLVTENYESGKEHYVYKHKKNRIIYDKVFSIDGKEILDDKGNCSEEIFDSIMHRKVIQRFVKNKLSLSGFMDEKGKLILLKSEDDARLSNFNSLQKRVDNNIQFPTKSLLNYAHGFVLVSFLIDTSGNIINFKIIKGLDDSCNKEVEEFIRSKNSKMIWDPARYNGNYFPQEIVVPFYFEINGLHYHSNNNNFDFMWHQQQMQRFSQPKVNIPNRPAYNFR